MTSLTDSSTSMAAPYEYSSTLDRGQIRLLKITAASTTEVINISLTTIVHDLGIKYIALSYAWGSPDLTHHVLCDQKTMKVTASLHSALWQLREDGQKGYIWADAICIHQANEREKTRQVRDMTSIYQRAGQTIIWLGPDDDGTAAQGIEIMRTVNTKRLYFSSPTQIINGRDNSLSLEDLGLPESTSEDWRTVGNVVRRPWFSRLWILREVASAAISSMRIGPLRIHTRSVLDALVCLHRSPKILAALNFDEIWALEHSVETLQTFVTENLRAQGTPLEFLMYLARNFKCADPKDRFFAIADCTSQSVEHLIDYSLSLEDIAIRFVRFVVESQNTAKSKHEALFNVLSLIDNRYRMSGTPSWCPSYRYAPSFLPLTFWWRPGRGCVGTKYQELLVNSENKLNLKSWIVDQVTTCLEAPSELVDIPTSSIHFTVDGEMAARINQIRSGFEERCHAVALNTLEEENHETLEDIYIQCLGTGMKGERESEAQALRSRRIAYQSLKLWWKIERAVLGASESDLVRICQTVFKDDVPNIDLVTEVDEARELLYMASTQARAESDTFRNSWSAMYSSRAFCATTNNRIGWVPISSRAGDKVCFFEGWDVPFVLRPLKDEAEPSCELIGACYLQEMMLGKAFDLNGALRETKSILIQ